MTIFIKFLGVIVMVMGIIFLINTNALRQFSLFWKRGKGLQIGAVIDFVFGIFFLMAASQCRLPGLITVFGILALIEGVLILTFNQKYLDWWLSKPFLFTRFTGLITVVFGTLLIYSA